MGNRIDIDCIDEPADDISFVTSTGGKVGVSVWEKGSLSEVTLGREEIIELRDFLNTILE